jgi:hypothetical protein
MTTDFRPKLLAMSAKLDQLLGRIPRHEFPLAEREEYLVA